jgi:hypothetical protein
MNKLNKWRILRNIFSKSRFRLIRRLKTDIKNYKNSFNKSMQKSKKRKLNSKPLKKRRNLNLRN